MTWWSAVALAIVVAIAVLAWTWDRRDRAASTVVLAGLVGREVVLGVTDGIGSAVTVEGLLLAADDRVVRLVVHGVQPDGGLAGVLEAQVAGDGEVALGRERVLWLLTDHGVSRL
jgi:hypothetical protein